MIIKRVRNTDVVVFLRSITASRSPISAAHTVANSTRALPLKLTVYLGIGTVKGLAVTARLIIS
jgi:hypothetical protein